MYKVQVCMLRYLFQLQCIVIIHLMDSMCTMTKIKKVKERKIRQICDMKKLPERLMGESSLKLCGHVGHTNDNELMK